MIWKHVNKGNDSKDCYVSLTVQININHLFTHLKDQKCLFQAMVWFDAAAEYTNCIFA